MTRRNLVYILEGMYCVSQEFNGDHDEFIQFFGNSSVAVNWEEIITLFDGATSLKSFCMAVQKAEELYGYEAYPVAVEGEIPMTEEVWMPVNGKLKMVAKYGEPC